MAIGLGTKGDMEGGANVETKDGTTSEGSGLPCTACTLNPVPEANKLSAELASEGSEAGTPTEHGGVAVQESLRRNLAEAQYLEQHSRTLVCAVRAACTVCEISATNSGEIPLIAGLAD